MAQKLFRDPLYDYIAIDKRQSWLLGLIDTPELQRLRYVSQLGMSHITYPGSNHSRFSHSLGVLYLMGQCISHLKQDYRRYFKRLDEDALLAAALLHDIGHAPFSHATESIFGDHAKRTERMILNPDSNVHEVLSKHAVGLPAKVAALIAKESGAQLWQRSLISSQLDVDRLDYLRRDALCSGAEYGNFDCYRITRTMQLQEKVIKGKHKGIYIVWPEKSKFAVEEYIFSRFYMYQSVYFHHTTRGFEGLLKRILKRAQDIGGQNTSFVKSLLTPMKIILGGKESKDPRQFQKLTDHVLIAQVTAWQNDKDKILSDLSKRLLLRKGVGWTEIMEGTPFQMSAKIESVRKYLKSKGKDPHYYFIEEDMGVPPYKPYSSASSGEEQTSVNSIVLFDSRWPGTGFLEITEVPGLERLRSITATASSVLRYYFPEEHQEKIKALLKQE
ncbi:MAG: HD domain-containing protein [Sedimentisphaerales bacterium]|jgi:HD superfamily phosphohydrolase